MAFVTYCYLVYNYLELGWYGSMTPYSRMAHVASYPPSLCLVGSSFLGGFDRILVVLLSGSLSGYPFLVFVLFLF